jgi:hypothetical protein
MSWDNQALDRAFSGLDKFAEWLERVLDVAKHSRITKQLNFLETRKHNGN